MGRQAPEGLAGFHLNLLTAVLAIGDQLPKESEQERAAAEAFATFRQDGFGYFLEMATRPQTIGYALLDSPVALAAWLLDHDTDSYYKISRAFVDGEPVGQSHPGQHPRQHHAVLADRHRSVGGPVVLGGRTSAGRSAASGQAPPPVTVPVGFTTFPGEIWASPRSWVEAVYPASPTSTRSTRAATSPPGRSPSSSPPRCGRRSARCADRRHRCEARACIGTRLANGVGRRRKRPGVRNVRSGAVSGVRPRRPQRTTSRRAPEA